MNVKEFIEFQLSVEDYSFSWEELLDETDHNLNATRQQLYRLIKKKEVISIRKGFYVILPSQYRELQNLPLSFYVDKLFKYLNTEYYVACFSASKVYGAGHQVTQQEFVVTKERIKPSKKNKFIINTIFTNNFPANNLNSIKLNSQRFIISSPALTIMDLIHNQKVLGGINRVLANIQELIEELKLEDLIELLSWYPKTKNLQRMGFIFEYLDADSIFQNTIFEKLQQNRLYKTLLSLDETNTENEFSPKWNIIINLSLDSDL